MAKRSRLAKPERRRILTRLAVIDMDYLTDLSRGYSLLHVSFALTMCQHARDPRSGEFISQVGAQRLTAEVQSSCVKCPELAGGLELPIVMLCVLLVSSHLKQLNELRYL